jgi:hypothetical protein
VVCEAALRGCGLVMQLGSQRSCGTVQSSLDAGLVVSVSTSRSEILARDDLRALRKRCLGALVSAFLVLLVCLVAGAAFASIWIVLLTFIPLVALRLRLAKLYAARCPRCGDHFFFLPGAPWGGWRGATLFDRDVRCVHCDLAL